MKRHFLLALAMVGCGVEEASPPQAGEDEVGKQGPSSQSPVAQEPVPGGDAGSGCVPTANDPNNCGACGNVCAVPEKGSVACVAGTCVPTCPAGTVPILGACRAPSRTVSTGGTNATCAVDKNQRIRCWGWAYIGQLANESVVDRTLVPVEAVGLTALTTEPMVEVDMGHAHACARSASGRVLCWGNNFGGALGINSSASGAVPTVLTDLTGIVSIGVGTVHGCALDASGLVKCWGSNRFGNVGNDSTLDALAPVPVKGLPQDIISISADADSSCAVSRSGKVYCWGDGNGGKFGPSWTGGRHSPVPVEIPGINDAALVRTSLSNVCVLSRVGKVRCWGTGNGRLGNGQTASSNVPVDVIGLPDAVDLDVGVYTSCAVTAASKVFCWGGDALVPVEIGAGGSVSAAKHTCIRSGDSIQCRGTNEDGQLGNNSRTASLSTLVPVVGF